MWAWLRKYRVKKSVEDSTHTFLTCAVDDDEGEMSELHLRHIQWKWKQRVCQMMSKYTSYSDIAPPANTTFGWINFRIHPHLILMGLAL